MSATIPVPVDLKVTYLEDYSKVMNLCGLLMAEVTKLKQNIAANAQFLPRFAHVVHDETLFAISHVKALTELVERYKDE